MDFNEQHNGELILVELVKQSKYNKKLYNPIDFLLSYKGAVDINLANKKEKTALDTAIENKDMKMIKLLLEHGAKPDLDKFGQQHDPQDPTSKEILQLLDKHATRTTITEGSNTTQAIQSMQI